MSCQINPLSIPAVLTFAMNLARKSGNGLVIRNLKIFAEDVKSGIQNPVY
jgi:hypothetical protein